MIPSPRLRRAWPLVLLVSACGQSPTAALRDAPARGDTAGWWATVQTRMAADSRAFRPEVDGIWRADVADARGTLDGEGLTVSTTAGGRLSLRTVQAGRADALETLPASLARAGACTPEVDPTGGCVRRVELARSATLTEWWRTTPDGYELGWDLAAPPAGRGDVVMDVAFDVRHLEVDDHGVDLTDSAGDPWRWAEVAAWDAAGRALPVRVAAAGRSRGHPTVRLVVDDQDAVYPITVDPLLTPVHRGASLSGGAGEALGYAVASVGDVNADGYADVVVGAPLSGGGDGVAYVYLGSSDGLQTSAAATLVSPSAGAHFGAAVASVGDTNGDGYDDVAVGGPDASSGRGVVAVYEGNGAGITTVAATTYVGATTTGAFGSALAGADLDNDGYADLTVGVPGDGATAGAVQVYAGSASGLGSTPTALTGTVGSRFGAALAAADLTGDGIGDLAVGAPDEGDGRVRLYRGTAVGLNTTAAATLSGVDLGGRFGASVGDAGDVDGDGYGDLVVGAPDGSGATGRASLYRGRASGVYTLPLFTVTGGAPGDQLGAAVDGGGDVNADGYADLVLGAPGGDTVYIYNGSLSGPYNSPSRSFTGASVFGSSLAGAGDVNRDGYDDVVVGSDTSGDGQVDVLTGSDGGLRWSTGARFLGGSAAALGSGVTGVGDVDHDGYDDVVVGAPGYSSSTGRAYLYGGTAAGLATVATTTWTGGTAGDLYGTGVANVGDVDGDGEPDLVIGAPGVTGSTGAAYLYRGTASGPSTTVTSTLPGGSLGSSFGGILAAVGDLNNDGYADLAVGAPNYSTNRGRAYVYLGSATGYSTTAHMMTGGNASEYAASALAGAGDVNSDGYDDLLVGGYGYNANQGRVRLYLGSAAGVSSVASQTLTGIAAANFGAGVDGVGDVNGDGYDDIVVGAATEGFLGAAHVYLGAGSGVATSATVSWSGPEIASGFGARVSRAGDTNGDGYPDILVGAPGDHTFTGSVSLYESSATGPGATVRTFLEGDSTNSYFGLALAALGDVNGDGYGDVAIGAPFEGGGDGAFYVHHGYVIDDDGDGALVDDDCDDHDAATAPGSAEVCDGLDNDCNGLIDDNPTDPSLWYTDTDGDGYGDPAVVTPACDAPTGSVADNTDCDDGDRAVHPDATEVCNGVDDDCDGLTDDNAVDAPTWYTDADSDGYGDPLTGVDTCTAPPGRVADDTDCDDTEATAFPGHPEVCDGIDDDCDGTSDEGALDATTWYADTDGDGDGDPGVSLDACVAPPGYVADAMDCDDTRSATHPGATETCNGIDDDCDGTVDDGAADAPTWYADRDGDTYGDVSSGVAACVAPTGYVADATDCDDTRVVVYPGAPEVCDGLDNDCDTMVDDGAIDAVTWYADTDGDSYGNASAGIAACSAPVGYVADATDCDDGLAAVHPGAVEVCNGIDDDCDSRVDTGAIDAATWYRDGDGDTYGDPTATISACAQPSGHVADRSDCDDTRATVHPDAPEVCDGLDNNCNGAVDDGATDASIWYADTDADTYGNVSSSIAACAAPPGYLADATDCDDTRATVFPGAPEVCDGLDNDCDTSVDEGATDATSWYTDADGDTYGDPANVTAACAAPPGTVADPTDCDDTNAAYHPGAPEACDDPNDYNCDGSVSYADGDGDGVAACNDCDDADPSSYPGNPEVCDGRDNDCDGAIDDGASGAPTWYADRDGDGYGEDRVSYVGCTPPPGYSAAGGDCDDGDAAINPGADERCDLLDNDCDTVIDEDAVDPTDWYADTDGDGYGDASTTLSECDRPGGYVADDADCNDTDATIHPDAPEACDQPLDTNCDGSVAYGDIDADGTPACEDCDDQEAAAFPGNPEVCDGMDNDCNGVIDDGLPSGTWYTDADGDSYGDPATAFTDCLQPEETIEDGSDCDDTNADVYPGNPEVCDDLDNDCDGYADAIRFESGVWSICEDTDGDGLIDYDEVSHYGTDPVQADTDHGGVNDGDETAAGTDPLDPEDDVAVDPVKEEECGCATGPATSFGVVGVGVAVVLMRRRRRRL